MTGLNYVCEGEIGDFMLDLRSTEFSAVSNMDTPREIYIYICIYVYIYTYIYIYIYIYIYCNDSWLKAGAFRCPRNLCRCVCVCVGGCVCVCACNL